MNELSGAANVTLFGLVYSILLDEKGHCCTCGGAVFFNAAFRKASWTAICATASTC